MSNDYIIKCVVPDDIPNKTVPIYLTIAGTQTQSTVNFILITPTIESFSPQVATFGDIVTITGKNFSSKKEKNVVKFNEHLAEVTESSKSVIKVKVPSTIRAKDNTISVAVNLQSINASSTFSILASTINSLSANKGFIGASV